MQRPISAPSQDLSGQPPIAATCVMAPDKTPLPQLPFSHDPPTPRRKRASPVLVFFPLFPKQSGVGKEWNTRMPGSRMQGPCAPSKTGNGCSLHGGRDDHQGIPAPSFESPPFDPDRIVRVGVEACNSSIAGNGGGDMKGRDWAHPPCWSCWRSENVAVKVQWWDVLGRATARLPCPCRLPATPAN